jgi:DNA-binding NarL/FixJ family response regulator
MYKISIIESQPIIREGLCSLLSKQLEFDILSSYSDYTELLGDCVTSQPDVVIFNLNFCDLNEVDAIQKIKGLFVNVKILVFSTNAHEECIKCAFRIGVHGYIYKDATAQELRNAIFSVTRGQAYLSTAILPIVINCFMRSQKQAVSTEPTNLTAREYDLLKLISSGYKNKEIAYQLCLSVKTIEAHRSNLMKKLNVHNVASLTTKANQLGVIHH